MGILNSQYNKAVYVSVWNALCIVVFTAVGDYQWFPLSGELQTAIQGLGSAILTLLIPNKEVEA